MSTNDVPGMNPANHDDLHAGCWAEHVDGTLLYVLGTEQRKVIYELFDFTDPKDPVEYRDEMPQALFEKDFSYDSTNPKSVKWTWHDKTAFPWNRIIPQMKRGVRPVTAKKQISDAEKVKRVRRKHTTKAKSVAVVIASERKLKARPILSSDVEHRVEQEVPKGHIASRIRARIQSAINKLKV